MDSLISGLRQLMEMMQANQAGLPAPAAPPPVVPGDPLSAQFEQLRQMMDLVQTQMGGGRQPARASAPQPR